MADFDSILNRMLGRVSSTRDKRQSSIIFNTLAPTAAELAQMNISKAIFGEQIYLLKATGINLDNLAPNYGIERSSATAAIRIAEMTDSNGNPIDLPLGSRFSTPVAIGSLNFTLTENLITPGQCLLMCETTGTVGNSYLGALLPLFTINNLGSATMIGTYIPAEDIETDEELRERILDRINSKAYGGNVADYKRFTNAISGVGDVKVFPVWNGGGTVMLSIIDSEYNVATNDFVLFVQNEIDPIPHSGEGLGIAPIGHRVTLVTPIEIPITITATISLSNGYTVSQLQNEIETAIKSYILESRKQWADANFTSIFIARITSAIINVHGINNVTDVKINGISDDLILLQSSSLQQLPIFERVVLQSG